jgi:hypothetical protein
MAGAAGSGVADDDLALCASSLDIGHGLLGGCKGEDLIDDRADDSVIVVRPTPYPAKWSLTLAAI